MGLLPSPNWCVRSHVPEALAAHRTHGTPAPLVRSCALRRVPCLAARYGSQLADWASQGAGGEALCAYAARNSVLLLRPLSQRVAGSLTGHTNRVTVRAR